MNDDLLTKFMLGETTSEENIEIEKWIIEDQQNQKYFKDFQFIWESSKKLALTSTVDENKAWKTFKERKDQIEDASKIIPFQSRFGWMKIAASLLLLIIAGSLVYISLNKKEDIAIATLRIESLKQVVTDTLPDGSVVTLNKNSLLSFPEKFTGNTREVKLEQGEAFFNVMPDKSKPFVVNTNNVTVNVVGTSFNVKATNKETEVIVETGVVEVSKKDVNVILKPKEMVVIGKETTDFVKKENKDQLHNYYRTKQFIASSTPLWRMVEVLNEAYNANIVIETENLRDLPLTATFKEESLENILNIISQTFNIQVIRSDGKIILK
ncbi:MAG TPA: FecR domain-containing protein [Cytophagales bacterium]|nr:FecR domain-containing protein [Cytophagales bacterium]